MPTKHRRIQILFKPKTLQALTYLSRQKEIPLSHIVQELIEEALELREDIYLSKLAEESERRAKGKPSVSLKKPTARSSESQG